MTSQLQIFDNMPDKLTFLPADFLVSRIAQRANAKGKTMIVTSGHTCYDVFAKSNRVGLWAKTFSALLLGTEGWYSTRCALNLKLKVTPYNRLFFQLQPSTLRTEETEFGLLPTPRTADVEVGTVKNVQTDGKGYYRTNTHGVRWGVKLRDVVESRMLPTPRAFAYKDSATDRGKSNLGEVTGAGSQLNPRFVAEMMGFPPNWTELPFQSGEPNQSKDMETP
jgi:hypothetical protein